MAIQVPNNGGLLKALRAAAGAGRKTVGERGGTGAAIT